VRVRGPVFVLLVDRMLKSAIAHELPRVPTIKPQNASNKSITNTTDFRQLSTILQQRRRLRAAQKTKSTPSTTPVVTSQLHRSLRTRKPTSRYKEQTNTVLDPTTGNLLEYRDLLKTLTYATSGIMHVPKNLHAYAMVAQKTTQKEQIASDSKNRVN